MSEESDQRTLGNLTPQEVLALVGDDVRASILWTLAEARGGRGNPPALPFSTLRERAAPNVDSSRFNYHLQRLVGSFIIHRDRDEPHPINAFTNRREHFATRGEGYALSPRGRQFLQAIRAGTSEGNPNVGRITLETSCHHCGSTLEAAYLGWLAAVQCPECDHLYEYNITPPGLVAGDGEIIERMAAYNRHERGAAARGVCLTCANALDHRFIDPASVNYPRGDRRKAMVELSCSHCGAMDYVTAGEIALQEPAVIGFLQDRGLDVTRTPIWALEFASTDRCTTVRDREPWEVTVRIERAGDAVTVVVSEDLSVSMSRTD